jgi:hypothetical protein
VTDTQLWGGILSLLIAMVIWVIRSTTARLEDVEDKNVEYRLEMDNLFVRKQDFKEDIVRLEKKLDRIMDTLMKR